LGQTTDRHQTDNRQTDIFELTPIHKGNFFFFFFFFFCVLEGENEWGEIYTSLLATQVCFTHLLRSQGDNFYKTKWPNLTYLSPFVSTWFWFLNLLLQLQQIGLMCKSHAKIKISLNSYYSIAVIFRIDLFHEKVICFHLGIQWFLTFWSSKKNFWRSDPSMFWFSTFRPPLWIYVIFWTTLCTTTTFVGSRGCTQVWMNYSLLLTILKLHIAKFLKNALSNDLPRQCFTLSTKYRRQLISKFLSFPFEKIIFDIFILQIFAQMSNCWSWLKSWKDSWLEENYYWCLSLQFFKCNDLQAWVKGQWTEVIL
jgi:hypothetical protein